MSSEIKKEEEESQGRKGRKNEEEKKPARKQACMHACTQSGKGHRLTCCLYRGQQWALGLLGWDERFPCPGQGSGSLHDAGCCVLEKREMWRCGRVAGGGVGDEARLESTCCRCRNCLGAGSRRLVLSHRGACLHGRETWLGEMAVQGPMLKWEGKRGARAGLDWMLRCLLLTRKRRALV